MKKCNSKDGYPSEQEMEGYSRWMMNKYASCNQQIALIANELNNEFVTDKMNFDVYYYALPKNPKKYIPYNAKKAAVEKEMRYIMDFYKVNQNVAKQYQKLIGDDEKAKIVEYFEKRGAKKK
jgi:hypothetical protein